MVMTSPAMVTEGRKQRQLRVMKGERRKRRRKRG
jgi:hypothetical protein